MGLDHEVNCTITSDGKVWKVVGDADSVDASVIPSELKGAYSYHNHPASKTHFSFSAQDINYFLGNGEAYAKASDDQYEYTMRRTEKTVVKDPDEVIYEFSELIRTKAFGLEWDSIINADMDEYHVVVESLSEELNFEYERKKRA